MKAVRLKTNSLVNPVGIDDIPISFSWNLKNDQKQTAYQICAAESLGKLALGNFIWTSGKIKSESMFGHRYGGEVKSRSRIYWKVRVWNEDNQVGEWSETAFFEMGLLLKEDWKASWITGNYDPVAGTKYPADYFRKKFVVTKKPVKARLYSTACGVYENSLNERKVGQDIFAPGRSTYEKRLFYQVYDITDHIILGENQWDILLGDGWFRGKSGAFGASYVFGSTTAYLGQIELTYEDGNSETIASDESFSWCNDGPIRMNDMKDFAIIDMNYTPSFNENAKLTTYQTRLCCSNTVPIREKEHFYPTVLHTKDGSTVLDFGQNIAGYVRFAVSGAKGEKVSLLFGEMLDEEGNFTNRNLITEEKNDYIPDYCDDSHFQKLDLILSGKRDFIKPKLTVQGFRYVKLIDWPEEVDRKNFEAIAVYSDMEYLVDFHSSDADIEKLVENTKWSVKGNYLDVPTDCPTRERSAWLGDAQLFFDTSCYFIEGESFYKKWIRDIFDDQAENGMVYNIIPRCAPHEGMNLAVEGSSGWMDAGILIPYRYYHWYQDREFLKETYPNMKKLMEYMISRMGDETNPALDQMLPKHPLRKYIVTTGFHFGEWNEPNTSIEMVMAPKYEVATAYLFYSLSCMAELSEELEIEEDHQKYKKLANHVKEAYKYYFVNEQNSMPKRMCEFVRPIALNILDNIEKMELGKGLSELLKDQNWHVGTGFLSTPFLLPVVEQYCSRTAAWKMLENRDYPSWLAEVGQGATTIWENWDGTASRNHYSNGAVCNWIFGNACGIKVVAENRFAIAPKIDGTVRKMELNYLSKFGLVSCSWEKTNDRICYIMKVPAGTTAEISLDNMRKFEVGAGEHRLSVML